MKLVRKQLVLDDEKTPVLEQAAKEKGVSVSAVVRWAIDQYLDSLFLTADLTNSTVEQIQQSTRQAAA